MKNFTVNVSVIEKNISLQYHDNVRQYFVIMLSFMKHEITLLTVCIKYVDFVESIFSKYDV